MDLSIVDLKEIVYQKSKIFLRERDFSKNFPEHYQAIIEKFPSDFTFRQKLYHYLNEDFDLKLGLCPICGNRCTFYRNKYGAHCSLKCRSLDPKVWEKNKITNLLRYGVENAMQCDEVADRVRSTKLERYGDENYNNIDQIFKTKEDRYGDPKFVNPQKSSQTKLERYGDSNYNNEKKMHETKLERYGDENFTNSDKAKQTKLERYGNEWWNNPELRIQTNLEKYGVEQYFQSEEYKNLMLDEEKRKSIEESKRKTCMERYGCSTYTQSEYYKNEISEVCKKREETNIKKYGKKSYTETDEFKQLMHDSKEEINKKTRETILNKNTELGLTDDEIIASHYRRLAAKGFDTKKTQGTLNTSSIENKLKEHYSNNDSVKFQYKCDRYPYHCDIYFEQYDLFVEIQGTWTHGGHPFDPNDENDLMTADEWTKLSENSDYYKNALNNWTVRDVEKRETAKQNNLRYLEIFSCDMDTIIKTINNYIENNCK